MVLIFNDCARIDKTALRSTAPAYTRCLWSSLYHQAELSAGVIVLQGEVNGDLPTVRAKTGLQSFRTNEKHSDLRPPVSRSPSDRTL